MSYSDALEAAGAIIEAFEEFGSYQGDWWAKVTYNGETGYVNGSYGSCSGCDAFEAEFGWPSEYFKCSEHQHDYTPQIEHICIDCIKQRNSFNARLVDFGKPYLEGLYSYEEAKKHMSRNLEWDSDAQSMLDWLEKVKE